MAPKPRIKRNNHRHAPYLWRCVIGRYNGYADTPVKAYVGCVRCFERSKFWESDVRRYPQLLQMYETAQRKGLI